MIRSSKREKTVSARVTDGFLVVRVPAWTTKEQEQELVDKVLGPLRGEVALRPPAAGAQSP